MIILLLNMMVQIYDNVSVHVFSKIIVQFRYNFALGKFYTLCKYITANSLNKFSFEVQVGICNKALQKCCWYSEYVDGTI